MEATPQRAQITESREATSGTSVKNALDKGRRRRQLIFIARLLSYCEFAFKARSQIVAVYSWATSTTTRPAIRPRKMQIQSDEWRLPRHACSEIERCILRIGNGQN